MSDWDASLINATWYGEVVFENDDGETESSYGYCSDFAEYPSPAFLCGDDHTLLSVKVVYLPTNDEHESWSARTEWTALQRLKWNKTFSKLLRLLLCCVVVFG